jgi:transcriptional regulator with XRE-family HTH domain
MAAKTITRAEIASLLGVTRRRLQQLLRTEAFSLPDPVGKEGYSFVYDRAMVLQLMLHWRAAAEKFVGEDNDQTPTFIGVLAGKYDRRELRERYRLKRIVSKSTKPKTVKESTKYAH